MFKLKLSGTRAVLALLILVAVAGFRLVTSNAALDTDAASVIRTQLVSDYTRQDLPELQQAVADGTVTEAQVQEIVGVISSGAIEFGELKARGHGGRRVVRAEISVGGAAPPDGRSVRYFEMTTSPVTGWRIRREVGAARYYLAF